ncbi:hypothetical protein ETAA8_64140 [Anatilimnocola aggregata]|uniref:Uncharacterized protein n=1 Tax=Anatilimnocola aggregata TaxID=2528021 RepID=A0A517YM18_9BACT|nr:hypothetical protein [Anatilimnocola aggregata]QDU31261.1 hypothetical protein ETAA8_64140 [Anatilimnocola aggregata]
MLRITLWCLPLLLLVHSGFSSAQESKSNEPPTPNDFIVARRMLEQQGNSLQEKLGELKGSSDFAQRLRWHLMEQHPVFYGQYQLGMESRQLLVYEPLKVSWPGSQPQTIIICDDDFRPLAWNEDGGSPVFISAELEFGEKDEPVLAITRTHRQSHHGARHGRYRFKLADDKIQPVGEIEWQFDDPRRAPRR